MSLDPYSGTSGLFLPCSLENFQLPPKVEKILCLPYSPNQPDQRDPQLPLLKAKDILLSITTPTYTLGTITAITAPIPEQNNMQ